MSDRVYKLNASLKINGKDYPCSSAWLEAEINNPVRFGGTLMPLAKDGATMLEVNDMSQLAAQLQKDRYAKPNPDAVQLTIETTGGSGSGSITATGVIASLNLGANTNGGMALEVSAASQDTLMDMFNGSIYVAGLKTEKMQRMLDKDAVGKLPIYVTLMKSKDGPVPKKIERLVSTAFDNWEEFGGTDEYISGYAKVRRQTHKVNQEVFNKVIRPFLESSNDLKLFGGTVDEDDEYIKLSILTGLHDYLFNSGGSFQNVLINGICKDLALWYVPVSKNSWRGGKLVDQKYGEERSGGEVTLGVSSMTYTTGNRLSGRPPCMAAGVLTKVGIPFADTTNSSGTNKAVIFYPEEPKREFGAYYLFQAPSWVALKPAENSKLGAQHVLNTAQEGKTITLGREAGKVRQTQQKSNEEFKKKTKTMKGVLEYLAKKSYFRALLHDSNLEVSGPFSGKLDAEIGDMVTVRAKNGGELGRGILSKIRYSANTGGGGSTTVGVSAVVMPGSKIE